MKEGSPMADPKGKHELAAKNGDKMGSFLLTTFQPELDIKVEKNQIIGWK